MYIPSHFEEKRPEVLHQLMHDHGLAVLVTLGADGLNANHIPLEHDPEPAPCGTIRGHVARANPVWRDFSAEIGALAIFQGPQGYITPSWYPTTFESGKVVPTYNYLGRARVRPRPGHQRSRLATSAGGPPHEPI